jgi:hypothetical protein
VNRTEEHRGMQKGGDVRRWSRTNCVCIGAVSCLLLLSGCARREKQAERPPVGNEWREFQGTWTATGNRQSLGLGGERQASIARFEGSLVLAGTSRPDVGFRVEVITMNDTATGLIGRAVWTDERGDQLFSELKKEETSVENQITGTFVGGTGRYRGAIGTYTFSWRFVIENDDGTVQGQSQGLQGQVRFGSEQVTPDRGVPTS